MPSDSASTRMRDGIAGAAFLPSSVSTWTARSRIRGSRSFTNVARTETSRSNEQVLDPCLTRSEKSKRANTRSRQFPYRVRGRKLDEWDRSGSPAGGTFGEKLEH